MRHPETLTTKSKTHEVKRDNDFSWTVTSGKSGAEYSVWLSGDKHAFMCSCDWAKYRPSSNGGRCGCSHVLAVVAEIEADKSRKVRVYANLEQATRQHRALINIGDGLVLTSRKAG